MDWREILQGVLLLMRQVECWGRLDGLVVGVLSHSSSGSTIGGNGFIAWFKTVAQVVFVMGLGIGHGRFCTVQRV